MSTPQKDLGSDAEEEAKLEAIRQRYKGEPFIPYDCNPYIFERPKLAYYGMAVTEDELIAYAKRRGLYPEPKHKDEPEIICIYKACHAAMKALSKKARFKLELHYPINPDFRLNIALYSNYTVPVRRLDDKDEVEVVEIIADEMQLPDDREPLWHYDVHEGNVSMRLKPWTAPSDYVERGMMKMYEEWGHDCNQEDLFDD